MSIEFMFPTLELSPEEAEIITTVFSTPAVRKYLKLLGTECSKELLALTALNETPESLAKKHTLVSGKLEVLTTLLSIKELK